MDAGGAARSARTCPGVPRLQTQQDVRTATAPESGLRSRGGSGSGGGGGGGGGSAVPAVQYVDESTLEMMMRQREGARHGKENVAFSLVATTNRFHLEETEQCDPKATLNLPVSEPNQNRIHNV